MCTKDHGKTLNMALNLRIFTHSHATLVLSVINYNLIASARQGHSIHPKRHFATLEPGVSSGAAACCRGGFSSRAMSSWNAC